MKYFSNLSIFTFLLNIIFLSTIFTTSVYATQVTYYITQDSDDAEQTGNENNDIDDSVLNFINEDYVGFRFRNIAIPNGAIINTASIQFKQRDGANDGGDSTLNIYGEDVDNPSFYNSTRLDLRTKTSASLTWNITDTWSANETGTDTTTGNLKTIVQEIVNRSGWSSGNAISFLFEKVSGSNRRPGALERGSSYAAKLVIDYTPVPTADLLLTENIVPSPVKADINQDINISVRASNLGTLDAEANVTMQVTYNQDINITSSSQSNGSDFNCSITSGLLITGSPIICTMDSNLTTAAGNKDFSFVVQATTYGTLIQTSIISSATADTNIANNTLISTTVPIIEPGFCEKNSLTEGFHIIDPDAGDDLNSYEIYCDMGSAYGPRELIALPLKNNYNNFVFEDDSPSNNYYDEADNARVSETANSFEFLQIKISGTNIVVVPDSIAEASSNEGYFSNINLIGTPFAIDWDNTTLSNCDVSKLRKGALDQAVKINTLDYTNGQCKVESMQLKLLNEYKYLTFSDIMGTTNGTTTGAYGSEIVEETCRQIFQKVPDDATHLPTLNGASNGFFWIDPDKGGRNGGLGGDAVTTKFRPFVAYCKYQEDIEQAWTFVMALDGKVTNSRNDVKTMSEVRADPSIYHDTCSQLGLLFFVPNTKDTFQRTQSYLSTNKNEWLYYTGTIREKFQMYGLATEYYRQGEGYNEIWPYGPFGVYHPYGGNRDINNNSLTWRSGSGDTQMGNVSGRCMNSGSGSGASTCTDYTQRLAAVTNDDGSLGIVGWRTTLMDQVAAGLQGITDGDQWWIADVGAGNYIHNDGANSGTPECSITSPGSNRATSGACDNIYYEPNGNYTQDAWLNFVADSNGNVYHNDDWNNNYPYYDYMCMSWDNYYGFSRYGLTEGPFTVIEHDSPAINTTGGYPITTPSDLNITTKIIQEPKDFDILLLSTNRAEIVNDQNISAGVFLVKIDQIESNGLTTNQFTDLHYYGKIGVNDDFNLVADPRGIIALTDSLSTIYNAHQRLSFQFKYCGYSNTWDSCWIITGTGANTKATCATGYDSLGNPNSPCQVADSNDFALRPDKFGLSSSDPDSAVTSTALIVKAKAVTIDYIAKDITGSVSFDYNASFSTLNTDITLINPGICASTLLEDTNQSTFQFQNGIESDAVVLSNVGEYTFVLEEIEGQEFAIVDANDTVWANRRITPNDMKLIIKPDHFTMTNLQNPNFNTDGNFTYLAKPANIDNMAGIIDFDITAYNSSNGITTNYTDGCYAAAVKLDVNYTVPTGQAFNLINYKVGTAASSSIAVSSTLGGSFIDSATEDVPKTVFADADLGVGKIAVKFNFDRAINIAKNPFTINLNNLNVSDQTTSIIINTTNQAIDSDATFVYGRAAGPKRASFTNCVDNPTNCTSSDDSPKIIFQIYRDNLGVAVPALNGASHDGTQDSRWWTSPFHDINNILSDGNITIPGNTITEVTGANVIQSALVEESNFRYRAEINYNGGDGYVKEANLKHTPSPWLIYDPDNAVATFNTFYHNYITEGWSGKNESSTTTKTKAANRTSKRILW